MSEWLLKYEIFYICLLQRFMNTFSYDSAATVLTVFLSMEHTYQDVHTQITHRTGQRGKFIERAPLLYCVQSECCSPITSRFPRYCKVTATTILRLPHCYCFILKRIDNPFQFSHRMQSIVRYYLTVWAVKYPVNNYSKIFIYYRHILKSFQVLPRSVAHDVREAWRCLPGCCAVYSGCRPDNGGSKYLWNVCPFISNYTEQHPRTKFRFR
jgi:hypothetical protein